MQTDSGIICVWENKLFKKIKGSYGPFVRYSSNDHTGETIKNGYFELGKDVTKKDMTKKKKKKKKKKNRELYVTPMCKMSPKICIL